MKKVSVYNLSTIFLNGSYKGETLLSVLEDNPDYVRQCLERVDEFSLAYEAIEYLFFKAQLPASNEELDILFDEYQKDEVKKSEAIKIRIEQRRKLILLNAEKQGNTPLALTQACTLIIRLVAEQNSESDYDVFPILLPKAVLKQNKLFLN